MSRFGKSVAKIFNDRKSIHNTTSPSNPGANIQQECDKREPLRLFKTLRYGFPYESICLAYDSVQHLLAIGTRNGCINIYGGELVEASLIQSTKAAVLFMCFVINEGALITYCEDSTLSFWNLRQKPPAVSFSRRLILEKATTMSLPFQSKWLYIGTEKGNMYTLNVYNNFSQSGYDIKWNNLIDLSQKTHPGKIVNIVEHPLDNSKLLIGFETGLIVIWNVKIKKADHRLNANNGCNLLSTCWYYDGKQVIASYENGYIVTWNIKTEAKPNITRPNYDESDLVKVYNDIRKVYWEANKNGDSMYIFSNGLSHQSTLTDSITIIKNKNNSKTIIEMKEKIVDFILLYSTPWQIDEPNDAVAIVALLENNLITIDLKTDGYPMFEHHHSTSLHESPISFYDYIVDPDIRLLQNLLISKEVQSKLQNAEQSTYSQAQYPVNGGIKGSRSYVFPFNELILTGHEDGTVKLWETSGVYLNFIYAIKTHKVFSKTRNDNVDMTELDHPFKISCVYINADYLVVAAYGGHVTLYKYVVKKLNPVDEELGDIPKLEIPYESESENPTNDDLEHTQKKELKSFLKVKFGYKKQQGYQIELVCLLLALQKPPVVTSLAIDPSCSLLVIGTSESLICVNYESKMILTNIRMSDHHESICDMSKITPTTKSPKKKSKSAIDTHSIDDCDDITNPLHFFTKQLTFDPNHSNNIQRTMEAAFGDFSRSPSQTSMENIFQTEGCCCIAFNEQAMQTNKNGDIQTSTTVWIGTTYGLVTVFSLNSISNEASGVFENLEDSNKESKNRQISLTSTGTKFLLKGQIVCIKFLDSLANVVSFVNTNSSSVNSEPNMFAKVYAADDSKIKPPQKKALMNTRSARLPSNSTLDFPDRSHYAVLCSESEAKVVSLPAHACLHKHTFDEQISKATVTSIDNQSFLLCYASNGSIVVLNLPMLKLVTVLSLSIDDKGKEDMQRIAKTFTFGTKGHAFYSFTPTEIQKLIISTNDLSYAAELQPELFDSKIVMPVAPKPSLFKSIFSNNTQFDREQLFGETSGKPSTSIVRNTVEAEVNRTKGELSELQKAALLRGEKLGHLEKRTEEMTEQARAFAKTASDLKKKYKKDSKWF